VLECGKTKSILKFIFLKLNTYYFARQLLMCVFDDGKSIQGKQIFLDWLNLKLNDLYSSPNIARVIKSRRMRWAGHVARMGEKKGCIGSCWGNRRQGEHWGDLGIDGWIILGWICRRWDVGIWTGLGWPRIETSGGRL